MLLVTKDQKDITKMCTSFPSYPENEIFRDNIVNHIASLFSPTRKVIMIEDNQLVGKTVLLSQFARIFPNKAVSFFIGDDYWSSNLHRFLGELCEQMRFLCNEAFSKKILEIDFSSINENELKKIFSSLFSNIVRQAKNGLGPYFFVIDGLDRVTINNIEENLLKFIPLGSPEGVYILLSSTKGKEYPFDYYSMSIPKFSLLETEKYLSDYVQQEDVHKVFRACDGMPGYLQEIRRQIKDGKNISSLINSPPDSFTSLLEKQWEHFDKQNQNAVRTLALVLFSPSTLLLKSLGALLKIGEQELLVNLSMIPFVQYDESKQSVEILQAYKSFLIEKLENERVIVNQILIEFFEKESGENLFVFLPELYKNNQKYESLVKLVNEESLIKMLGTSGQVSLVRRNLRFLSDMAFQTEEWQKLSWAALAEAVFTRIVTSSPALEDEINALLALDDYQKAIALSLKCILPEDRLQLLSNICNKMKENGEPISEEIIKVIEDSVNLIDNTIELTEKVIEKLLDICADLFPIQASIVLRLLKRISEEKGEVYNDNLMDLLVMRLALKAQPNSNSIDEIKTQLGRESVEDFAMAASSAIAVSSIESILNQVEQINDVSAKLFLLQTWCNRNREEPTCHIAVKQALDIMTESETYSPTQMHMRQFAQALQYCKDTNIAKELVSKLDILKETVIKNPVVEYARLELTLASVANNWSNDESISRLYSVIFYLDEIVELDSRCQVLVRILLFLGKIVPEDKKLEQEIRSQFKEEFNKLLESSADHFLIAKSLLPALTNFDPELAENFVDQINTANRRDLAFSNLIRAYIKRAPENISFDFLESVLGKIYSKHYRDWVFVQVLKHLSKNAVSLPNSTKYRLKENIYSIKSSIGKSYALAYYIVWLNDEDHKISITLFEHLQSTLQQIPSLEEKMTTGFQASSIIAKLKKENAKQLFDLTVENKNQLYFSDSRINDLYISTCQLLIRMIPEISKSKDSDQKINNVVIIIKAIPSIYDQCNLLSSLALKCLISGKETLFKEISEICLKIIENCSDEETLNNSIMIISPMLYQYERNILLEKIRNLPTNLRDTALGQVTKFILTRRLPDDVVDIKFSGYKIEYRDALQICDVLEYISEDVTIHQTINGLVDVITEPGSSNKLKSRLHEKHLITLAEKLTTIINQKLPDKNNIKHRGYYIASMASVAKLRYASPHNRAIPKWQLIIPDWDQIKSEILNISNISDRIFVLATTARKIFNVEPGLASSLLAEAEECLNHINNHVDRVDRYQTVAEVYHETSNSNAAKFLLEKAMGYAKLYSYEDRDQLMGGIIETAHTIDNNLATNFASQVDNPIQMTMLKDTILALNLHSDPQKIDQYKSAESNVVLDDVFERVIKSLVSGRGTVQHNGVIGKWIQKSLGHDFDTVNLVTTWFIENTIAGSKSGAHTSQLDELFSGVHNLLHMIKHLGEFLIANEIAISKTDNVYYQMITATNLMTFSSQQGEEAIDFIEKWIRENTVDYLKIYEPYFNEDFIYILKYASTDCRVQILTSLKTSEVEGKDLKDIYRRSWFRRCDQNPPETHIYVYYTNNGKTPMHDRFILTDKGGLFLGTSLNGYGSKDSTIRIMELDEKQKIETEVVNPFMSSPSMTFEGQRLYFKTFTLDN